jgi:hypothetical protein
MNHAATDTNNDGTHEAEYGDTSDYMGNAAALWQRFSAPHRLEMGWLKADANVITRCCAAACVFFVRRARGCMLGAAAFGQGVLPFSPIRTHTLYASVGVPPRIPCSARAPCRPILHVTVAPSST